MNFTELKQNVQNGQWFPVYVIEGEDAYFRKLSVDVIVNAMVSEPSVNLVKFEGEELKDANRFSDLMSSIESFPFLSKRRVTVVSEYYPNQERLKQLNKLFGGGTNESSVLVVVNENRDENVKKINGSCVVDCKKMDKSTIARWIKSKCEQSRVKIELETASLIAEYCLSDMSRISVETEKLICYALKKGEITVSDVMDMVNQDSEYKIYEMTEALAKRQKEKALNIIFEMMDKGETPARLLTSVYNYFRRMLHVAITSMSETETAKVLGIKEFALKKIKQQASSFRKISLKKAVDVLEQADYRYKSGQTDVDGEFYVTLFKILLSE